jgi:hypothetical protein
MKTTSEEFMKRSVLKFGLLSATILLLLVSVTWPLVFSDIIPHMEYGELVGYSTMLLAFLMVFFGIRSYRDTEGKGTVTFGRAFLIGILITLFACAAYVLAWEVLYYGTNFGSAFMGKYTAQMLVKMKAEGASPAEIAAKSAEMAKFAELYKNPLINIAVTLLEIFPVGLVVTLVSAAILRRKVPREMNGEPVPA